MNLEVEVTPLREIEPFAPRVSVSFRTLQHPEETHYHWILVEQRLLEKYQTQKREAIEA